MRHALVALLIAIPIAVLGSAPAHACSCVGGSSPVWPPDGAADIPLDAPIVVATSDLTQVETKLAADDGSEVELVERGRLALGQTDCVNDHYLFLTPAEPLQPQRRYVVLAQGGAWNPLIAGALAPQSATFVTGNALRDTTPPELALNLYATSQPEGRALELFVEAPLTEPVFIGVSGTRTASQLGRLAEAARRLQRAHRRRRSPRLATFAREGLVPARQRATLEYAHCPLRGAPELGRSPVTDESPRVRRRAVVSARQKLSGRLSAAPHSAVPLS